MFSRKIKLKKLADIESGAKFLVSKNCQFVSRICSDLGSCLYNLLCDENLYNIK
jgi:hypothetical protein